MTEHYACRPEIAYRAIDGHVFLITPDGRQHELHGDVENAVWRLCESGDSSFEEIVTTITEQFDVSRANAVVDLTKFLDELISAGIVRKNPQ